MTTPPTTRHPKPDFISRPYCRFFVKSFINLWERRMDAPGYMRCTCYLYIEFSGFKNHMGFQRRWLPMIHKLIADNRVRSCDRRKPMMFETQKAFSVPRRITLTWRPEWSVEFSETPRGDAL